MNSWHKAISSLRNNAPISPQDLWNRTKLIVYIPISNKHLDRLILCRKHWFINPNITHKHYLKINKFDEPIIHKTIGNPLLALLANLSPTWPAASLSSPFQHHRSLLPPSQNKIMCILFSKLCLYMYTLIKLYNNKAWWQHIWYFKRNSSFIDPNCFPDNYIQ